MSEPKQIFYDKDQNIIAWSRFGVLWRNSPEERLGSFHESDIFDNSDQVVAKLENSRVFDIDGKLLGKIEGPFVKDGLEHYLLVMKNNEIGKCKYTKEMAAAVIALLGEEFST